MAGSWKQTKLERKLKIETKSKTQPKTKRYFLATLSEKRGALPRFVFGFFLAAKLARCPQPQKKLWPQEPCWQPFWAIARASGPINFDFKALFQ
jgi:hypothetical protein